MPGCCPVRLCVDIYITLLWSRKADNSHSVKRRVTYDGSTPVLFNLAMTIAIRKDFKDVLSFVRRSSSVRGTIRWGAAGMYACPVDRVQLSRFFSPLGKRLSRASTSFFFLKF